MPPASSQSAGSSAFFTRSRASSVVLVAGSAFGWLRRMEPFNEIQGATLAFTIGPAKVLADDAQADELHATQEQV